MGMVWWGSACACRAHGGPAGGKAIAEGGLLGGAACAHMPMRVKRVGGSAGGWAAACRLVWQCMQAAPSSADV